MKNTIIFVLLLVSQFAQAKELIQVHALNNQLKKVNAGWVAKESSYTHLTKEEAKHFLGLRQEISSDVEFVAPQKLTWSTLPRSFDWRNKDGKNWVSPILNQGSCGSCVAFAAVGVMETQYKIASSVFNFNVKLSPQNLFSCGGGSCDWGWVPGSAASFLQRKGVTDEACMPYVSGASGSDLSCNSACADAPQRSLRIASYSTPTRSMKDIEAVKAALQKGPVVTTLTVYEDFMLYSSGVYKHVAGQALGGHAISIVGYDDDQRAFIIRNSWGVEWGEQGFGRVSYEDVSGVGSQTWLYEIPALNGAVSIESPLDYSYYSDKVPLKAFATFASTDSLQIVLNNAQGKAVWSGPCATAHCAQDIDVSTLADGRYQVQVLAMDSNGAKIGVSTQQFFYIANQKPKLTLAFAGMNVDLNKAVSDRIEFSVDSTSSSVPMSSLEFHFRGPDGKETVRKSQVVLSHMVTGWRTNLVPNGNYEVWMVGHVTTNQQDTFVETAHKNLTVKN